MEWKNPRHWHRLETCITPSEKDAGFLVNRNVNRSHLRVIVRTHHIHR